MLGMLGSAALIWYFCLSGARDDRIEPDQSTDQTHTPLYPDLDPPPYDDAVRERKYHNNNVAS
ncbi:unnamed protein product [Echinostoma caproni]|uniref:Secreted protein n=1 Tax=Echinostoma caproni TaxID=27848 RepID=A0A183BGH7_9TREM|nr:unnamed protein product [Echinostoma caproni]